MKDSEKFKGLLMVLCERYDKTPSPVLSRMIWEALKPYPDEICIKAFNHVFLHGRYYNDLVPDLIAFIEQGQKTQDETRPSIEADKVIAHLNKYGSSVPLKADDPVTQYLMDHVWPYRTWAASVLTNELKWWRKDFINAYKDRIAFDSVGQIEAKPELKQLGLKVGQDISGKNEIGVGG